MKTHFLFPSIVLVVFINISTIFAQSSLDDKPKKNISTKTNNLKIAEPLTNWVNNGVQIYNLSDQVGIGTSTPTYKLDILHGGSTGIQVASTSSYSVVDIDAASGDASLRFQKAGVNQWNVRNDPATNNFQIFELGGGGERFQIQNTTGNFGLNDASPTEKLSVGGKIKIVDGSQGVGKVLTSNATGVGTWQPLVTPVGWAVVGANMYNSAFGNVSIGTSTTNAPLQFANTAVNRKIVLYEAVNNDHQYYGFGINASTLRYQVESVNSSHIFYAGLTAASSKELFRISGNGSVTVNGVFTLTSDARLKKNIKNLNNPMANILALNAKTYNWIDETKPSKTQIGLIAQELEEIYPELVDTNETGFKSVNYIGLVPILLEGIKDLQNQVNAKNADIEFLKKEFIELKAQVNNNQAMNK